MIRRLFVLCLLGTSSCATESAVPTAAPDADRITCACDGDHEPPPEEPVVERVDGLTVDRWLQGTASLDEGRASLLVFFELWCPHCQREVPRLQALHTDLGPQGLQVIGLTRLSRGVEEEQLLAFLDARGVTYPVGRGTGALAQQLGIRGIPAAAVVRDGEVLWQGHPANLSDGELAAFLE